MPSVYELDRLHLEIESSLDARLQRAATDLFHRLSWHRLGLPFERLVPSYATVIGASADRPTALAEFMGIIANDDVRRPGPRRGGRAVPRGVLPTPSGGRMGRLPR